MKKVLFLLSLLLTQKKSTLTGEVSKAISSRFQAFAQSRAAHGGALIVQEGNIILPFAYGKRDSAGNPFTVDTPCRVASVSKLITATAVLKLVQDGRLNLDDKALTILNKDRSAPLKPRDSRMEQITVRNLLQHSSGFASDVFLWNQFETIRYLGPNAKLPIDRHALVDLAFTTQPLGSNPGSQYKYSNTGFLILARVIEQVSKKPYQQYVQEDVLRPMGIGKESAYIGNSKKLGPSETQYWDQPGRTGRSLYPEDNGATVPFPYGSAYSLEEMDGYGGWVCSARALAKFMVGISKVLTPRMQREAVTRPSYAANGQYTGLGFVCVPEGGNSVTVFHGGSLEGCNATAMLRANGQIITAVFNTGGPPNDNVWAGNLQDEVCNLLNQFATSNSQSSP